MSIDLSAFTEKKKTIEAKEEKKAGFWNREITVFNNFGDKEKMHFYKELSGLLVAGVDFKRALEILIVQQTKEVHKKLIGNITNDVISGKGLYEALRDSGSFSPYEYFSIKIGEETRNLDPVLVELNRYFERKIQMKRQILSVFTYPIFVLVLTFGVLYFMMKFVVPMFATVFKQFDKELPALTQKIIYVSENFTFISMSILLILILVIVAHFNFRKRDSYRKLISQITLKLPFVGNLIRKIYITRFSQSLSLLLKAKTPLVPALELVQKMISFYPIESSLDAIRKDITRGVLFSKALEKHRIYDHKLISLVNVAEHTNTLGEMFERISKQYDEETQHQTKMIGVIMEPLLILIIGAVVGVVLIAMYSPMFDLSKILQNN